MNRLVILFLPGKNNGYKLSKHINEAQDSTVVITSQYLTEEQR